MHLHRMSGFEQLALGGLSGFGRGRGVRRTLICATFWACL
jgi:hypothetical protein